MAASFSGFQEECAGGNGNRSDCQWESEHEELIYLAKLTHFLLFSSSAEKNPDSPNADSRGKS